MGLFFVPLAVAVETEFADAEAAMGLLFVPLAVTVEIELADASPEEVLLAIVTAAVAPRLMRLLGGNISCISLRRFGTGRCFAVI